MLLQLAFGYIGLGVLAGTIMMNIFTGLNGFLMSSSRLLFSMGRSGIMPMFSNYIVNTNTICRNRILVGVR